MNQDILIETAAKEYAEGTCTDKKYGDTTDLVVPKIKEWAAYDFTAGASFALSCPELYRGLLVEFAEWIRTFEALERLNGHWVIESQLSDEQIVKAFIKNKQESNEQN